MALWPHLFTTHERQELCWQCEKVEASWVPGEGYLCERCLEATAEGREDDDTNGPH